MWKNLYVNKNQIQATTASAVLIAMPHNSEYDGFVFWHPSKLVREGSHRANVSISYTDDFVFRLKKYGKGKYNSRDVIDEIPLAADELEEAFGKINENIETPEKPQLHTPPKVDPENATADESLIDNE